MRRLGYRLEPYAIPGMFATMELTSTFPTMRRGFAESNNEADVRFGSRPHRLLNTTDFLASFYNGRTRASTTLPRIVASTLFSLMHASLAHDILLRRKEFGRRVVDLDPRQQVDNSIVALVERCS